MHYKTIKFNIKIPPNIQNFHFCAKFYIASLRARRADFLGGIFLTFAPPPSEKWIDAAGCPPPPHFEMDLRPCIDIT